MNFKRKFLLWGGICISLIALFTSCQAKTDAPIDKSVITGQLENGFSYFIQHNEKPKRHASIRLVVKTGSIQEEDDQQGIAHFTEHMAFNGSKHFPDNQLIEFLEMTGVEYGPELNAYTSFEETVYKLEIPLDNPSNLTTGLKVIEDWAFGLTMPNDQIDKERGVILQERRDRRNAWSQFQDKYLSLLFNGAIYASRFPIGLPEIVQNISYERFKEFYQKWYTPDRMAIVAVGDFDAHELEKQIQLQFEPYQKPQTTLSVDTTILNTSKTDFLIETNSEFENQGIWLFTRQDVFKGSPVDTVNNEMLQMMASLIINQRFDEKLNSGIEGISAAYISNVAFNSQKSFFLTGLEFKEDGIEAAMKAWFTELEWLRQKGALSNEISQAKSTITQQLKILVNEYPFRNSATISDALKNSYLMNEPNYDVKWYQKTALHALDSFTTEQINHQINQYLNRENRVCALFAPKKFKNLLPTENQIVNFMQEAQNYVSSQLHNEADFSEKDSQNVISELEFQLPKAGKIISTRGINDLDGLEFILSNQVRVLYRQSNLSQNRFYAMAYSLGGTSLASDSDFPSAELADDLSAYSPLVNLSRTEKNLWLSRNALNTELSIDELSESLTITGSVENLEAAFQWIFAQFLPLEATQADFEKIYSDYLSLASNLGYDPQSYFSRELNEKLRPKKERNPLMLPEVAKRANFEKTISFYNDRFNDASDFTFVFTGNIPLKQFKSLLKKYLAVLPSDNNRENAENYRLTIPKYPINSSKMVLHKGKEDQALIYTVFTKDQKWNSKLNLQLKAAMDVLTRVFDKEIREKESGTYSISAFSRLNRDPYEEAMAAIVFSCDPSRANELIEKRDLVLNQFLSGKVDPQLLDNFKKIYNLQWEKNQQSDAWWLSVLTQYAQGKLDLNDFNHHKEKIDALTLSDLLASARSIFHKSANTIGILLPE